MSAASLARTRAHYERFAALSRAWPIDTLRPASHFGPAIARGVAPAFGVTVESEAGVDAGAQSGEEKSGGQVKVLKTLSQAQEKRAQKAIEALEGLRDSKALHEFPTPQSILQPASHPQYYTRLRDVLQRAASGESYTLSWRDRLKLFWGAR